MLEAAAELATEESAAPPEDNGWEWAIIEIFGHPGAIPNSLRPPNLPQMEPAND